MSLLEIVLVIVSVGIYIGGDLYTQNTNTALETQIKKDIELLQSNDKILKKKTDFKILSKNFWDLEISKRKKRQKTKKLDKVYDISKDKKSICKDKECFEVIAIEDEKTVIFYDTSKKTFLSLKKSNKLNEDLIVLKLDKNIVLQDKNNNKYMLSTGFVDINIYNVENKKDDKNK
jgi:hypothetical protein